MMHPVADRWRSEIENNISVSMIGEREARKFIRLSRTWRRILGRIEISSPRSIFEVGVGTGSQLLPLAGRGYSAVGMDCSLKALIRCRDMAAAIERFVGHRLKVSLICGDFFDLPPTAEFSLVFHRGVSEHYLDREDRLRFTRRMFEIAADDGYVISIVPSGIHPFRSRFRDEKLGGYNIPEIDYSPELLREEAKSCGGKDIVVLSHNIMGHLLYLPGRRFLRVFRRSVYLFFQALPQHILPVSFRNRYAYSFICIARKEGR